MSRAKTTKQHQKPKTKNGQQTVVAKSQRHELCMQFFSGFA